MAYEFGRAVKRARIISGHTQKSMAALLEVAPSTYKSWEWFRALPSLTHFELVKAHYPALMEAYLSDKL